uniref:G-protein coupled receptors family 2 profile 2 domain-containing protein n=1 Tax=Tetranychus urticae TaxID=32264 RepID=T1KNL5_TETUR
MPYVIRTEAARRWCRQKFSAIREADLISIESCDAWNKIPDLMQKFVPIKQAKGSTDWIWTQLISGPRIKDTKIPETVMEHLNGHLNTKETSNIPKDCWKNVDSTQQSKGTNVVVILVNGLTITPKLVPRSLDNSGHALCEFRFTPGIISTPPEITETPPTTEDRSVEPLTEDPIKTNVSDADQTKKKVDNILVTLTADLKSDEQPAQKVTEVLLENLQNDSFVLSTSDHLDKTVELARELVDKIGVDLATIGNKTVAVYERITFTKQVCSIFSTLMEDRNEQCWNETGTKDTKVQANSIITTTEKAGLDLACELDRSAVIPVDADSIQMEVYAFDNETEMIDQLAFPSKQLSGKELAEIKFPKGIDFGIAMAASPCGRPTGLGTIIKEITTYMSPPEEMKDIVSQLVSFSFGETVEDVNVQVSLAHSSIKRRGDVVQCVFWDSVNKAWNSSGCVYDEVASTRRKTVCHCTHLTNFAILMDMTGREEDDQAKSILSLICLTASVISLILTIFFLITLPPVKSTPITNKRVAITTNLCICLLVSNFILMFGVEHTESILWCRVISATLFYSLAATFTWMLLEGYLLYQMIVVVPLNFEFRSRWLYLLGYGLALIWLGVTIAVLGPQGLYDDTSYYCWISNPINPSRIWFFAGPVALIILLNTFIYGKSIQIALLSNLKKKNWAARGTRPDQKSQDNHLVRRWLKGSCSLMILLGITWSIGFLYFHEYSNWLSYAFIVVNGSQGVFIFLFEIVTNSKARPAIIRMVSGKFPSTQVSSVSKTSSSNPLSTLSTRSSKLTGQQSLHGKDSSKGSAISTISNAITERKKTNNGNQSPVTMELK